jgi:hypothetical protein
MEYFEIKKPSKRKIFEALISEELAEGEGERILRRASTADVLAVKNTLRYIREQGYRILESENYFLEE